MLPVLRTAMPGQKVTPTGPGDNYSVTPLCEDAYMSSLLVPETSEIADMSPAECEARMREFECERRRLEASIATFVHRVEHVGAHLADRHRTVTAWGKAACNWSGTEAARFARVGRMLARFPSAAVLAERGELGVAQMGALASVVANPRVAEHLDAGEALLVGQALVLDFDDYVMLLTRWEAAADADGAHDAHERAHRNRKANLSLVGEQFFLDGCGGVAQGVQLKHILDAFAKSEWMADWEAGVGEHGDAMCPGLMERTDAQRRLDALVAIFLKAAAATGDTSAAASFVVNLVVGQELFEHHLTKALGGEPAPLDANDPCHRCETTDGVQIDPYDMLVAAAIGHVRRVVLDSAGVVIDMGRRQRLFTGALRDAVMMGSHRCIWPGCNRPASQCEADHLLPYAHTGHTATRNGGPQCGPHNRWKTNGYRTWRDPGGHWHHQRPDGTEIGWRAGFPELVEATAPNSNPAA